MPKAGSLLILIFFFTITTVGAQTLAENDDNQSWNDVQLTIPVAEKVDILSQFTFRFGRDNSRLNEHRIGFGIAYKFNKHWTALGTYQYINARNAIGNFRREDRFDVRAIVKYPVKGFGLTHRSIIEHRSRRPLSSWTYRAAITIDHEFPPITGSKLYVTDEVFRDSLTDSFSRNRFTVGINKVLTEQLSVDLYYLRQNDGFARPGNLNVIGTTWRIRL